MLHRKNARAECGEGVLRAMTDIVAHRGPDGSGVAFFGRSADGEGLAPCGRGEAGPWSVGLGHRRLSILDLSDAGAQPMRYRDYWISFNGEVYNYIELRGELERLGFEFRSGTDTEVVLAAYAAWGVGCFRRFHGMWGLVLVDTANGTAVLSRDRVGIKPLYLYEDRGVIAACSEIKQLTALPKVRLRPDGHALIPYLLNGYEDPSRTMFADVRPVPAGTWQVLDLRTGRLGRPVKYWHPDRVKSEVSTPDEAADIFAAAFGRSMELHVRSDVPVGCALSGGLDSSTIAVGMRRLGTAEGAVHTFSVTFPGESYDERRYVDDVLGTTGFVPHFVTPTGTDLVDDLDAFVWAQDEPVRSVAQYAAFALARLTRANAVPVTLNGQGGDEILSAYWQSYFRWMAGLARGRRIGSVGRELLTATLPGGNAEVWRMAPSMARRYRSRRDPASAIRVRSAYASDANDRMLHEALHMTWPEWRVHEITGFTFPRLLKWDDRNFMAFSVEGRYPLLDHKVIEACLSFEPSALYRAGWTKVPLRRAFESRLPESVARRKTKVGFESPQGKWLSGPLRPLIRDLVTGDSPVWQYIEQASAAALAARVGPASSDQDESAQVLLRLLLADRWMRLFHLHSAPVFV